MDQIGSLYFSIVAKDDGVQQAFSRTKKGAERARDSLGRFTKVGTADMGKVSGSMGKMGSAAKMGFAKIAVAAVAAAAAVYGLVKAIKATVMLASDATEVDNKFNVVFKTVGTKLNPVLDDMAKTLGRSRNELKSFVANTGDLLKPLGYTEDAAAGMSTQIVQLGVDLASFNNKADADVINDLHAALTGSGEVMKKYGVVVNETAVKAELATMGFKGMESSASEAAKAQARWNIILRGTTDAQGDAERSSGSFANLMKRLWGLLKDIGAKVGTLFIPALEAIVDMFNGILGYINSNIDHLKKWGESFGSFVRASADRLRIVIAMFSKWETAQQAFVLIARTAWQGYLEYQRFVWKNALNIAKWFFKNLPLIGQKAWAFLRDYAMPVFRKIFNFALQEAWSFAKMAGEIFMELATDIGNTLSMAWEALTTGKSDRLHALVSDTAKKYKSNIGKHFDDIEIPLPEFEGFRELPVMKEWAELVAKVKKDMADTKVEAGKTASNFEQMNFAADNMKKKVEVKVEFKSITDMFKENLKNAFKDKDGKDQAAILQKQVQIMEKGNKQADKNADRIVDAVGGGALVGA